MKKIIVILVLLIILNLNYNEDVTSVFNEDNDYNRYELNFLNKTLNTNNFLIYFNEITVISIEPYINSLYEKKLNFKPYIFDPFSNASNINNFKKVYNKVLDTNGYKQDTIINMANGVYIRKMVIYASTLDVNLLQNNLKFEYKNLY